MKKLLILSLLTVGLVSTYNSTQALADPIGDLVPACTVSLYTPYTIPLVTYCEEYKAPTGQVLLRETYIAYP